MPTQTTHMIREVHLTGKDLMNMVQLRHEDVGKYAIVPGPRERLENLIKKLENPIKNFTFMEYSMYTGGFAGTKVTAINGGRFSADTAITTELLCNAKPQMMIRIGSCGSLSDQIKVGDLIVATSAWRGDGVTPYYVKEDYQPQSDQRLTETILNASKSSGLNVHTGRVWSTDAILKETKEYVNKAINQNCVGVDMVSSVFLTLADLYKIPAAVVLAVSDHILTGEMGFLDPNYYMAESAMITIALNAIKKMEGKS